MRFQQITEVPMNPTAYAAGIETGATKGVVVGFEFEVCVPKATIQGRPEDDQNWWDEMPADWYNKLDLGVIDYRVVKMNKPVEFNGKSYDLINSLLIAWIEETIKDNVKAAFDKCTAVTKRKIVDRWEAWKQVHTSYDPTTYQFAIEAFIVTTGAAERRFLEARFSYRAKLAQFWIDMFGSSDLSKLANNPDLTWDPAYVFNLLNLDDTDENDYNRYDYGGAVKALKKPLTDAFGKVIVFSDYHQRSKDATSWYIEPDGSLEPKNGDGAAEVVTPPLPVKEGIAALKTFFGIAKNLNLYTSKSNKTGLHINVSIPDKLDVLKLAVFTGDQYVLKAWGRENNGYATSVLKSLTRDLPKSINSLRASQSPVDLLTKPDMYKKLVQIARDISDDHMASISYNGNYVSFRHAGGDYLNDEQSVLNVVGRFIRAMVIASDPNMYKQEYMSKLANLVQGPVAAKPMSSIGDLMAVRSAPIAVRLSTLYPLEDNIKPSLLDSRVERDLSKDTIVPANIATPLIADVLTRSVGKGKIGQESYGKITSAVNSPAQMSLRKANTLDDDLGDVYARGIYDGNENKIGIMVTYIVNVDPKTPLHNIALQQVMVDLKDKLRRQKKIGQR